MKKIILFTAVTLLSLACLPIQAKKQEQSPYANDVKQAAETLKKISKKIQSYYTKHTTRPEQQNDFAALTMENPSSKDWTYTFFCEDDNLTPDKHACNVFAEQKTQLNNLGQHFFLQMQMPPKKNNKFGRIIWVSLRNPRNLPRPAQTSTAENPVLRMTPELCAQFKGNLQKGLCVLDGHF